MKTALPVLLLALAGGVAAGEIDEAFFQREVEPLLRAHCYECHSHAGKIKGGLALDSAGGWRSGGDSGPAIVPGDATRSLLMRAIRYADPTTEMPPKGRLDDAAIAVFERWITAGAPDPRGGAVRVRDGIDLVAGRQHWAFRPLRVVEPPVVRDGSWVRNEVDRFILHRLEAAGLRPAPPAEAQRFRRRLAYDLTGLPPSDGTDAAVESLLTSPAFGEKWGRAWLDLARYADSNGASFNVPYPEAWRYRTWVIAAFNDDMPYDRFIAKQIAGDLLPANTAAERDDNLVATGFLMLGSKVLGEFDKELLTLDVVDEQVDTIGRSVLALTLGCARCHDHKFDPVPQSDYYALAGIFTSTVTLEDRYGGPKEDESDWSRRGLGPDGDERLQRFLAEHRHEWIRTGAKRHGAQQKLAKLERDGTASAKDLDQARTELQRVQQRFDALQALAPAHAMAVRDHAAPGDTTLRIRGVPGSHGEQVPRGFLQVASWPGQPAVDPHQSGRLQLAHWLSDARNPLTARVVVNRVWQQLFGRGLARDVDNFGLRGEPPTHPELLDWLAQRFIADGWRLKPLIRLLVTSSTYRMAVAHDAQAVALDPENRLRWRQERRRLSAEEIRDSLLWVAGDLDRAPVTTLVPDLPSRDLTGEDAGLWTIDDRHRTIYQPLIRTMEPDVLRIFDGAPSAMSSGQRATTTVAPQALYFLNAPLVQQCSRRMGEQVAKYRAGHDVLPVVRAAFARALGRGPDAREERALADYLLRQFTGNREPSVHDLAKLCQVVLASTQFQYLE